jgi:hypothetical protein
MRRRTPAFVRAFAENGGVVTEPLIHTMSFASARIDALEDMSEMT